MTPLFRVRKSRKNFCRPRTFPASPNIFGCVPKHFWINDFHLRKVTKAFPAAPKHFRKKYFFLFSGKIPEVTRTILAPSRSTRCLPKPFRLSGLLRNNFSVLSLGTFPPSPKLFLLTPKHFRFSLWNFFVISETFSSTFSLELFQCLRNFFDDFFSDSLSSIQQIDDP